VYSFGVVVLQVGFAPVMHELEGDKSTFCFLDNNMKYGRLHWQGARWNIRVNANVFAGVHRWPPVCRLLKMPLVQPRW
jgi:hypothetical protein